MASSVRAKAAMFGQLAGGSSSSDASSAFGLPSGSRGVGGSSTGFQLPPTSSAPIADPSISHPITAPFLPRSALLSNPTQNTARIDAISVIRRPLNTQTTASTSARRKKVDVDAQKEDDDHLIEPIESPSSDRPPPMPPVKPFPPKLSDAVPQTPFDVDFPDGEGILGGASARSETASTSAIRQPFTSRIPRISVGRNSNVGSSLNSLRLTRDATTNEDFTRESVYSTTSSIGGVHSAVVSKANAVSIQRVAQQPRTMRGASPTPTGSSPRAPSVDKGIGVKTRRKSRESTSSERRRAKSSNRNSTATAATSSERQFGENTSISQTRSETIAPATFDAASNSQEVTRGPQINISMTKSKADTAPSSSTVRQDSQSSKEKLLGESFDKSISQISASSSKSSLDSTNRLLPSRSNDTTQTSVGQPMDRTMSSSSSISSANFTSARPKAPWQGSSSISSRAGGDGWISSNASEVLDPLSDAWGQNSSAASVSYDENLSSMGALAFSPSSSPLQERAHNTLAREQPRTQSTTPSANGVSSTVSSQSPQRVRKHSLVGSSTVASASSSKQRTTSTNGDHPLDRVTTIRSKSNNSTMSDIKGTLLTELLASMSLVDTQSFEALASLEQVEALKRELGRTERRIVDVQHKLKVHMRMRDAADKLRRTDTTRSRSYSHATSPSVSAGNLPLLVEPTKNSAKSHQRIPSTASSVAVSGDAQQSEADFAAASKQVDQVSRHLMELFAEASTMRRRLLEHHARVLALRVQTLEDEEVKQRTKWSHEHERGGEETEKVRQDMKLALDELGQTRDQLMQVEQALANERKQFEKEKRRLGLQHEAEKEKLTKQHHALQTQSREAMERVTEKHQGDLQNERDLKAKVEERMGSHERQLAERERLHNMLQQQMEQLEFETTAERNIMLERQKLFGAFEKRLERAELRLREQDERCARMLGKAEGREEMDDLLNQIKFGANGAPKKEKTAGQDIDGLIDSLTTHIDDLEDELQRAAQVRTMDSNWSNGESDSRSGGLLATSSNDTGAVRELTVELQSSQREADEWRKQAEGAKRHLAALQRQSALSVTSTNARMSVTGGWGASPSNAGGGRMRLGSMRSAAELEARVALLEKRNAALEAELAHVRDTDNSGGLSSSDSPFDSFKIDSPASKLTGNTTVMTTRSINRDTSRGGGGGDEIYAQTITTLLNTLPALPADADDLHEIQEELEAIPRNSGIDPGLHNAKEVCRIVSERTRNVLFISRSLVGKTLTLEMERRDFDEQMETVEGEREELKVAMEDLRTGHASQMQIIEAGRSREEQLGQTVCELEHRVSALREEMKANEATSLSRSIHQQALASSSIRPAPSLTSLISSQAGPRSSIGNVSLQQRRNVMPVRSTRLAAPPGALPTIQQPSTVVSSLSPSSSKLSFASSTHHTASTPATSHPAWSPAELNGSSIVGPSVDTMPSLPSAHLSVRRQDQRLPPSADDASSFDVDAQPPMQRAASYDPQLPQAKPQQRTQSAAQTPRTMMLGLGTSQMMERIRQLEAQVALGKVHANRSKADEEEKVRFEQVLHDYQAELEENRREMEEIRNVESRQRIELLEELTSLTSELTEARAQLRQEHRLKQRLQQQSSSSS